MQRLIKDRKVIAIVKTVESIQHALHWTMTICNLWWEWSVSRLLHRWKRIRESIHSDFNFVITGTWTIWHRILNLSWNPILKLQISTSKTIKPITKIKNDRILIRNSLLYQEAVFWKSSSVKKFMIKVLRQGPRTYATMNKK